MGYYADITKVRCFFYMLIGNHLQDISLGKKDKSQNCVCSLLPFMQNRSEIRIYICVCLEKLWKET